MVDYEKHAERVLCPPPPHQTRLAGWLAGGGAIVAGLVLLATVAAVNSEGAQIVLGITAAGLGVASVPVGLPLILWEDTTAVELRPTRVGP